MHMHLRICTCVMSSVHFELTFLHHIMIISATREPCLNDPFHASIWSLSLCFYLFKYSWIVPGSRFKLSIILNCLCFSYHPLCISCHRKEQLAFSHLQLRKYTTMATKWWQKESIMNKHSLSASPVIEVFSRLANAREFCVPFMHNFIIFSLFLW